ncbi:unnamed protein product [Effrenium voratum]|uniref:Uncharacterized protein n=1 Tax=Effrenium voratum TaxID=2562239 RepID=A0AA36HJH5_9DINO|nr:unnamed protein product [Effrenium voratum]
MTHLPDDEQALKNYVEERSLWTEMRAKLEQSEVEIQEAETIPGSVPTFSHHDGAFQRSQDSFARDYTLEEYEKLRGKFRRLCEPKRGSGNIEVPGDIFKQYMDAFLKVVTMEKSHEKTHELEEEGGFYTPEEMKELLHYKQTFGP